MVKLTVNRVDAPTNAENITQQRIMNTTKTNILLSLSPYTCISCKQMLNYNPLETSSCIGIKPTPGIIYICPDCKNLLYCDKLSRELHKQSCSTSTNRLFCGRVHMLGGGQFFQTKVPSCEGGKITEGPSL